MDVVMWFFSILIGLFFIIGGIIGFFVDGAELHMIILCLLLGAVVLTFGIIFLKEALDKDSKGKSSSSKHRFSSLSNSLSSKDTHQNKRSIGERRMFFQKKRAIKLFQKAHSKINTLMSNSALTTNSYFEIIPAAFVIAIIGASHSRLSRKDQENLSSSLISSIISTFSLSERHIDCLHNRISFYSDLLESESIRGDWLPADSSGLTNSPVGKVFLVFGDVVTNPACIIDYENALSPSFSREEKMLFYVNTMYPAFNHFCSLCESYTKIKRKDF